MKKLKITRKIPIFTAYQWDGSIDSYRALAKELVHQADVEFHTNADFSWLTVEPFNFQKNMQVEGSECDATNRIMPGQYLVFSDEGMTVLPFQDMLLRRYDVVEEENVYTGRLQAGLDNWNKTVIKEGE